MFPNEPRTYIDPNAPEDSAKSSELQNGRWAMIGFVAAIGAYSITGNIIPGIFQLPIEQNKDIAPIQLSLQTVCMVF